MYPVRFLTGHTRIQDIKKMPVKSISRLSLALLVIAGLILIIPCSASLEVRPSTNIALAKGDPLTITGTGFMNGSAAIWEFGPGFFAYTVIPVAPEGSISWTQRGDVTGPLMSGPLMIVVQDPGRDQKYSVHIGTSGETRQVTAGNGTALFDAKPAFWDIPAAMDLAKRVREEIAGEKTDDSATLQMVFVEEPAISFSQEDAGKIPSAAAGEGLRFSGTTNLAPENRISARIERTAVIEKTGLRIPIRTGTVTMIQTDGLQNRWEYTLNTSGLEPGEYLVTIGWDKSSVSGQAAEIFRIVWQPEAGAAPGGSTVSLTSHPSVAAVTMLLYGIAL